MLSCFSSVQLFATLYGPQNLPGSSVHGILQARILEWVAIPFYRGSSWPRDQTQISHLAGRFFIIWATKEVALLKAEIGDHASAGMKKTLDEFQNLC